MKLHRRISVSGIRLIDFHLKYGMVNRNAAITISGSSPRPSDCLINARSGLKFEYGMVYHKLSCFLSVRMRFASLIL